MTNHEIKGQKENVFNIFLKSYFWSSSWVLTTGTGTGFISELFLCTGARHHVPSSFSLFSNMFCFLRILDFSECTIFHIRTRADMKYYAPASVEL